MKKPKLTKLSTEDRIKVSAALTSIVDSNHKLNDLRQKLLSLKNSIEDSIVRLKVISDSLAAIENEYPHLKEAKQQVLVRLQADLLRYGIVEKFIIAGIDTNILSAFASIQLASAQGFRVAKSGFQCLSFYK